MSRRATSVVLGAAALALLLGACSTAGYYWQGIAGELDLLNRAEPIPAVVETTSDPALKQKLEHVLAIREFASRELALPDNASYRRYTALDRRFVLWNVFATPPLSLAPRQWCFPVAGCVNYRGYFDEAEAKEEATRLMAAGDDAYVGGVPAYSTLGYFADPVPSTVIRYPEPEVARLIFHELAHQVVYVKDDTVFNESFAVSVEEEGVRRWLAVQHDRALTVQFDTAQRYRKGFLKLVAGTRAGLAALYASDASDAEKLAGKTAAFAAMRSQYEALRQTWGGYPAYDSWFAQGSNNAGLIAVALYSEKVPQFQALLVSEGGDLPRFYLRVKQLAAMPKPAREQALAAIAAGTSAAAVLPPVATPPARTG
jgi:predicted aminopeptidase